jgi:hypothetical protein
MLRVIQWSSLFLEVEHKSCTIAYNDYHWYYKNSEAMVGLAENRLLDAGPVVNQNLLALITPFKYEEDEKPTGKR